ncbi:MAG: CotH kinase family protein [Opitutales bacterium]
MFFSRPLQFLLAAFGSFLFAFFSPAGVAQDLLITEFMASNGETILDEDGDASDWIEIYNGGSAPVPLAGWHLTDNADRLTKWTFPAITLSPNQFLLVFASGKDRAVAGSELHTNFSLSSDGEYLGLIEPDGETVAHDYAPEYPPQLRDISYGIVLNIESTTFLTQGAPVKWHVPLDAEEMPFDWKEPELDAGAWADGTTGLGFGDGAAHLPPGTVGNVALGKPATQSSTDGSYTAARAVNGDFTDFTHTLAETNLPAWWEVDLQDNYAIESIVLWNRTGCCQSRLRDITVEVFGRDGGEMHFTSELLNPQNVLGGGQLGTGPEKLSLDLTELTGGLVIGGRVRVTRTPDPEATGTGGQRTNSEQDVLSLAEVEVLGAPPEATFPDLVETNIEEAMAGSNRSVLVRLPFMIPEETVPALDSLTLRMKYADGFVAYLNGIEVARRNAPETLDWDSTATAQRPGADAVRSETIDISAFIDLLMEEDNVLAVHGLNSPADRENLLILPELVGRSGVSFAEGRYFAAPAPRRENTNAGTDLVEDPEFTVERGFHAEQLSLQLVTQTEGAEIRYTLDGSAPSATSGFVYSNPIAISGSTVVRALAFKPGALSSQVVTHTYIFPGDAINQPSEPEGFPLTWRTAGGFTRSADYEMDGRITEPNADKMHDSLRSLSSVFVTTSISNLFDTATGIYANSGTRGIAWERPASVEWVTPEGETEFQINCGLRMHGGWFRRPDVGHKHSFRLMFRAEYGDPRLNHDVFKVPGATREFNRLVFRAGGNDGYTWSSAKDTEQFIRDEFGRRLQMEMGHPSPHGKFVHLYLNGLYWGLYNVVERPNHHFSASYLEGEPEDWDSYKHMRQLKAGTWDSWNTMTGQMAELSSFNDYRRVQGLNPDGTRNPDYPVYYDKENYIDYIILNLWAGNWDWGHNNYWMGRNRTDESTGFKYFLWDFEDTLGMPRSPLHFEAPQDSNRPVHDTGPLEPHLRMRNSMEYRIDFADRVHRYFFNKGLLTPQQTIRRYRELADHVEPAILPESARWGDQHHNPPQTVEDWRGMRNWLLNTYLPQRTGIVLQQFRNKGLYPSTAAPVFSQHGGFLGGEKLSMAAPTEGTIYYTLNGEDPRIPGSGEISANAIRYEEDEHETGGIVLEGDAVVRARVLSRGWSALNEAPFFEVPVEPHNLAQGPYHFGHWDPEAPAGTYPDSIIFEQTPHGDPDLRVEMAEPWNLPYNLTSRSRIRGLGNEGISFINTANVQDAPGAGYVGVARLLVDTRGTEDIHVQWTAGTVTPNERVYGIRLQYRVNGVGNFLDVVDEKWEPFEYLRNEIPGHTTPFGPVRLPSDVDNEPYVELRWKYYYVAGDSGPRAELRLDNIHVAAGEPGEATSLVFENQPAPVGQSEYALPVLVVRAVDDRGLTDRGFNKDITLSVSGSASHTGTGTVRAVDGVAVFKQLRIEGAGALRLTASAEGIESGQSGSFRLVRVTEQIMPRYIQGDQDSNNENLHRLPFAYRLLLEGLRPEATYRYGNRVVVPEDSPDQNGAGNAILITGLDTDWIRNTDSPRFRPEDFGKRHLTFSTDEDGSYTGWFLTEPTGNARFTPGNIVYMRLLLNDGKSGEEYFHRLTTPSPVEVKAF